MTHGPSLFPPWAGVIFVIAAAVAVVALVRRLRRAQLERCWADVARWMDGSLETLSGVSDEAAAGTRPRLRAKGRVGGRAAFLGEGVSYEDAVPYPHTRGALNVRNPASVVMGLRHKSVLEEALTRRDTRPVDTGDSDFDRVFFLLLTTPEHAAALLPHDVRRELMRHGDVEVYLKGAQIEWRRAGTLRDGRAMRRLFETVGEIADALEALPHREIALSQKLADEALIDKGV